MLERLLALLSVAPLRCEQCNHRFYCWTPWYPGAVRADRRQYERIAAKVLIGIQWEHGQEDGVMTDVSLGGAALESDVPLAPGTLLQVTFEPTDEGTLVGVHRAVVRSVREGRLGVEFTPLTDDERRQIGTLVTELVRAHARRRPG